MKKTYIQPASTIIVMTDALCSFLKASVEHGTTGEHVDDINVVEGDESADMGWGADKWGGD